MDTAYETDFVAWPERQAELLRTRRAELESLGLDVDNLVDEIESLWRTVRGSGALPSGFVDDRHPLALTDTYLAWSLLVF